MTEFLRQVGDKPYPPLAFLRFVAFEQRYVVSDRSGLGTDGRSNPQLSIFYFR